MKKICVFCGSSFGKHPVYTEKAAQFGNILANQQKELVYGGGNAGLMGEVARAVINNGGKASGVIPHKIHENVTHIELNEIYLVDTMHERKGKMYELADGFIVLPGGIGTYEEMLEVLTWQQIGFHDKPIGIYNINGFFEPFRDILHHMTSEGFLAEAFNQRIIVDDDPESLLKRLETFEYKHINKWG